MKKDIDIKSGVVAIVLVLAICLLATSVILGVKYAPELNKSNNIALADYEGLENKTFTFNQYVNNPISFNAISSITYSYYSNSNTYAFVSYSSGSNPNWIGFPTSSFAVVGHKFLTTFSYNLDIGYKLFAYSVQSEANYFLGTGSYEYAYFFETSSVSTNAQFRLFNLNNQYSDGAFTIRNYMIFDLTVIYGSGNEPTTIEQFKSDFPLDYYNYSSGIIWKNLDGLNAYQDGYDTGQSQSASQIAELNQQNADIQQQLDNLTANASFVPYNYMNTLSVVTGDFGSYGKSTSVTYDSTEEHYTVVDSNPGSITIPIAFQYNMPQVISSGSKCHMSWNYIDFSTFENSSLKIYCLYSGSYYLCGSIPLTDSSSAYSGGTLRYIDFSVPYDTTTFLISCLNTYALGAVRWSNVSIGRQTFDYQQIYDSGKQAGISSVNTESLINQGYNNGYTVGYANGSADHNNYFLQLATAPIDATLSIFDGIWNWELFGVNLKTFLLTLFSITIVVVIVKFALGGK